MCGRAGLGSGIRASEEGAGWRSLSWERGSGNRQPHVLLDVILTCSLEKL